MPRTEPVGNVIGREVRAALSACMRGRSGPCGESSSAMVARAATHEDHAERIRRLGAGAKEERRPCHQQDPGDSPPGGQSLGSTQALPEKEPRERDREDWAEELCAGEGHQGARAEQLL